MRTRVAQCEEGDGHTLAAGTAGTANPAQVVGVRGGSCDASSEQQTAARPGGSQRGLTTSSLRPTGRLGRWHPLT